MTPEDWRRIDEVYREALDCDGERRASFLDEACRGDAELRREVESLLRRDGATGPLAATVQDVLGQVVAAQSSRSLAGQRIGAFHIIERIGAGGMGEVYRARDSALGRDVAIKVLPPMFLADGDRRARFEREARVLASLNHPHIGGIYGVEDADEMPALVLEFVDGPTLADRLRSGPLPLREALEAARQVADALEAAHEKGIVHRDLKPANIKLAPDGTVKVIDFGLARGVTGDRLGLAGDSPPPDPLSVDGMLLGTTEYMSPEQARGKSVDRRADVWAFGCVLYEMLTARRAFSGDTTSDTVAAIMTAEPDWNALPADTPANMTRLLRRCLQKDAKRRLRDIGDARLELEEALNPDADSFDKRPAVTSRWRLVLLAAVAVFLAIAGGLAAWRLQDGDPAQVARFAIHPPAGEQLGASPAIAISPDGTRIAYVSVRDGISRLFIRSIDDLDAMTVTGSEGAAQPFFSPNGQWVAFFADRRLKKVSVVGGTPATICDVINPRGGAWAPDDTIVFGTSNSALLRVPAKGGTPAPLTELRPAEGSHRYPVMLPNGRAVLFAAGPSISSNSWLDAHIDVQALPNGVRRTLIPRGTYPRVTHAGLLLYVNAGVLQAVAFDSDRLEITGDVMALRERLFQRSGINAGSVDFDIARTGSVAFVTAHPRLSSLVWVDRQGTVERIPLPAGQYFSFTLSPDKTRLAYTLSQPDPDIWIHDLVRQTSTRLTTDGASQWPVWTPDGRHITFASTRTGSASLFWRPSDGSGQEERLTTAGRAQAPRAWTPDGRVLLFDEVGSSTVGPWLLRMPDRQLTPLPRGTRSEGQGALSPDSRWIAYASNDSGRNEVYVRGFPDGGQTWRVSGEGGEAPKWNPNGRELFYRIAGDVMAADVHVDRSGGSGTPAFKVGTPRRLFGGRFQAGSWQPNYDVSADGQRFVMLEAEGDSGPPASITLVMNWIRTLPGDRDRQ